MLLNSGKQASLIESYPCYMLNSGKQASLIESYPCYISYLTCEALLVQ